MSLTSTHIISKKYLENMFLPKGEMHDVKNKFPDLMEFKIQVTKKKPHKQTNKQNTLVETLTKN